MPAISLAFRATRRSGSREDIKHRAAGIAGRSARIFYSDAVAGLGRSQGIARGTGVWMDPDMNKYDLEHVTTGHPGMTASEWQEVYRQAWDLYYSERAYRSGSSAAPRQAGSSRCGCSTISSNFTSLSPTRTCIRCRAAISAAKLRPQRRAGPAAREPGRVLSAPGLGEWSRPTQACRLLPPSASHPPPRRTRSDPYDRSGVDPGRRRTGTAARRQTGRLPPPRDLSGSRAEAEPLTATAGKDDAIGT